MLVRRRKVSQKYFHLLGFNKNLNYSNPWSTLGVVNFRKWELYIGSPGSRGGGKDTLEEGNVTT